MADNKTLTAHDATISATTALLTKYDAAIVNKFDEESVLTSFGGTGSADPGLDTLSWKIDRRDKRPAQSRDGNQPNLAKGSYDTGSNKFVSINQFYELTAEEIERSKLSSFSIESKTAENIGIQLKREQEYMIWNGATTPIAMTGIAAGGTDLGAPSGVWDVAGIPYDDISSILAIIHNLGWKGAIDVWMTPGLKKIMPKFISDGTTSFANTVGQWLLSQLNGGRIEFTSHPVTAITAPATADDVTGGDGTAVNTFAAIARGAFDVVTSRNLTSVPQPAAAGDIKRNIKTKFTVKTSRTDLIGWMNAIDNTT